METDELKGVLEAGLLAAGEPLSLQQLTALFEPEAAPGHAELRQALDNLQQDYADRAMELREVGSGYRIQVRSRYQDFIRRLWEERPPRYSQALLETLALIAYRQPTTRSEIEDVRGVSVSTNIIRTLTEREWVRVVGYRDVPGKPALLGTTKAFLDYFNLRSLDDLPTLAEIRDIDDIEPELEFEPDQPIEPGEELDTADSLTVEAHDEVEPAEDEPSEPPEEADT